MPASRKELPSVLNVLGPKDEAVPPETVWGQTSRFYLDHWRSRWPDSLPLPPVLDRPEKILKVSRARLFEIGQSIETEADAVNFYVAVSAWGAGTSGLCSERVF